MPASLRIGTVARETGLSIDTIRFYQKSGLIPRLPRTGGGYRIFGPEQLLDLRFIGKAQELGFSLREIKELLLLRGQPGHSCPPVRDRLEQKLVAVREKIDALRKIERELQQALRKCKKTLPAGPFHEEHCPLLAEIEESWGGTPVPRPTPTPASLVKVSTAGPGSTARTRASAPRRRKAAKSYDS